MTKQVIKARLELLKNLAEEAAKIEEQLCEDLTESLDDDIYTLLDEVRYGERSDIDEVMNELEENGYFAEAKIADGEGIILPHIDLSNNGYIMDMILEIPGEAAFVASANYAGNESAQVSLSYRAPGQSLIDLAMVEVKMNDLAEISHLSRNNKDVDLYVWEDLTTEDYTRKTRFSYEDLKKIDEE